MCICGLAFSLFFYCLQPKLPKSHPDILCQPQSHTSKPLHAVKLTDSRKCTLLYFVDFHWATLIYACWSYGPESNNTYTAQLSPMCIWYYPYNRCTIMHAYTYPNIWQSQASCNNSMNSIHLYKTHKHFIYMCTKEVHNLFHFTGRSMCS